MIIVSCFPKLATSSGDKSTLALFRSRRSICSKTNKSKNEQIWWPLTSCMFWTHRSFRCLQTRDLGLTHAYMTATAKTTPSKKISVSILLWIFRTHIYLELSNVSVRVKTCLRWIRYGCVQFQIEIRKISCCGSRSPDNAELGHFTLLFCRGRQRDVHSHCSAH